MSKPAHRYVVLTEGETSHLVAIRREGWQWLRVVAVFASRKRAEAYADVENVMAEDGEAAIDEDEIVAFPPADEDPGSRLRFALDHKVDRTPHLTRTEDRATMGTLADEVLAALPAMMERFPLGPTAKDISEWLSVEDYYVRRAMNGLHSSNRATLMRRKDSKAHHLIPIGHEPPADSLTSKQSDILNVIKAACDVTGYARISRREICQRSNTSQGGITSVIDALVAKKRLQILEHGGGSKPCLIRVLSAKPEVIYDKSRPMGDA